MAHGDLHPRGEHDPDVELHLHVLAIKRTPKIGLRLKVLDNNDEDAVPTWMDEQFIDYMHPLETGKDNVFLVPRGLAVEWGLVR